MAVPVEAIEKLKRAFEAGPESGCARGCGGCPLAASCRPQTTEVFKIKNYNATLPKGTIFFSEGGKSLLMRIKEKICSICKKADSICGHSELKTGVLVAA